MKLLEKFLVNELGIDQPEEKIALFKKYETLLLDWNEKINLVSRKTGSGKSIEEHILNSVFFLKKYPLQGSERLIDIGTGGGFPGIPLKILYPGLKLSLLDSIQKKTNAVKDIVAKLNLENTETISGRAEEISKKIEYSGKFDIVITKAVSSLSNIYIWGKDFLKGSGKMLCIKGGNIEQEISGLEKKFKQVKTETIEYSFPSEYNIQDKKIIIITW